jgi:dUTP pyrophosphatase
MKLKVKKTNKSAVLPSFAHPGDAGMDLFASENIVLKKGEKVAVPTGISMEIPEGYVGLIWDKSGLAIKNGLKTLGGVIDSGYRGEILIGIINLSKEDYIFEKGHKVAQMIIQKKEDVEIEEVDSLDEKTSRGGKGFGSTGK